MAGKTIQNNFTVDVQAEANAVLNKMDPDSKELLLLHYISKEVEKKQDEIRKNYKDLSKFLPESFTDKVHERLIKKVLTGNNNNSNQLTVPDFIPTEMVSAPEIIQETMEMAAEVEQELVAAKPAKKSKKG